MSKKIIETTERWCCEPGDLVTDQERPETVNPTFPHCSWNQHRYKVCKHCGTRYEWRSYIDVAGSRDWYYREIES